MQHYEPAFDEKYAYEVDAMDNDWNEDLDSQELADAVIDLFDADIGDDFDPSEVEDALFDVIEGMSAAEAFNLKKALRQIKKSSVKFVRNPYVGQIAGAALPIAGGAVGTVFGGPVGTAIGTKLGQVAGQAVAGQSRGGRGPKPKRTNVAAAQLLQLTQNPDVLKGLLALSIGGASSPAVSLGSTGTQVPVNAIAKLLSNLAGKAAEEARGDYGDSVHANYLEGVDPGIPENDALYALFSEGTESEFSDFESELHADDFDYDDADLDDESIWPAVDSMVDESLYNEDDLTHDPYL